MLKELKLATACLAGALVTVAMTPSSADEQFTATTVVQLPNGETLSAFDISFVDPKSHTYALAASRVIGGGGSVGEIIIVDTQTNLVTKELKATPSFVGDCSVPPA